MTNNNLRTEDDVIQIFIILTLSCTFSNSRSIQNSTGSNNTSIETNSIQTRDSRGLKRVFLSNRTITCNDGSQAGFYLRKSKTGSKRWVMFLEGGWYCYDQTTCRARWMKMRTLMTSAQWPETKNVGGILSPLSSENPFWHDANHVFVPYCSSDSWSGTKVKSDSRDGWRFMGSLIVKQVVADLIPLGLGHLQGGQLLLVGSSAGGLGVMLNIDKVKKFLHDVKKVKVKVKGVSDSGWFLEREPFTPGAIAASEAVRRGLTFWQSSLPEACTILHAKETWRCFFGHRLYPTLKAPLFVFQWLFDEAQMRADSVGAPVTPQQWNYIHEMGGALRSSLENVTAVFAPSCMGHSVLTKRDWLDIKIDNISLAEALRCWERAGRYNRNSLKRKANETENIREKTQLKRKQRNKKRKQEERLRRMEQRQLKKQARKRKEHIKTGNQTTETPLTTMLERSSIKIKTDSENIIKRIKNRRNKNSKNLSEQQIKNVTKPQNHNKKLGLNNNNHSRNISKDNNKKYNPENPSRHKSKEPKNCNLRLMERCSWPQCNHSCPSLTNPLTGEEMRFLELLTSFGLDIEAVASALGLDMTTLNNMDHAELVNLLTQQVN